MARLIIKTVMARKGVTRYRLAQALKMDPRNLSRVLKPGANVTFDMLCRIAKALKCRVRDLIKE